MKDGLIKIRPDKEKATSLLKMVSVTLDMIKTIDAEKFPSNIIKEYYDVIRELISAILIIDGYKTVGEKAHKKLIKYQELNYKQLSAYEIFLIDDLRITRNKIAYDGFFVREDYVNRIVDDILKIISRLQLIIDEKLK